MSCVSGPACPGEGCHLTESEGWTILIACLGTFAVLAGLAVPLMVWWLRRRGYKTASAEGTDFWYTARNSQGWPSIAFSITATSAGGWLLYTPAEAAVLGGWWALIGYMIAIALGPIVMCIFAPKFREQMPDSANITDWVLMRFGPVAWVWVTLILIYYMFIYLAGQLKTMGDMTVKFTGMEPEYGMIPLAAVTVLYTMIGGLPASIVTDWIQAVCILILVLVICIMIWGWVDVKQPYWEEVAVWNDRGWEMFVSLCFAVFGAEVFNLAFWQRIYAAKDVKQLRIGFLVGAFIVSALTGIFGVTGMLLKAQDLENTAMGCQRIFIPAFTFFDALEMEQANKALRIFVYVLVVCMIASNADSFQTAMTSTVSRFIQQQNWRPWMNLTAAELFVIIVNVPCVFFAVYSVNDTNENFDGLAVKLTDLFSMADILTITLVAPLFLGVWPFVTSKGALAGMWSGMLFIMCWGWFEFDTFMGGMEMITMMCFGNIKPPPSENGAPGCGFYSARAAIMFPVIPIITGAVTLVVSYMERSWETMQKIAQALPDLQRAGSAKPAIQEI